MALFSAYLTYHFFPFVLNVITSFIPCILPLVVFGVPQGSVLGPILFVMYTTPLNTLIYYILLDRHLYADDTQLFFSFYPLNYKSSISHYKIALQQIFSWMTANVLTLNSYKTEFLHIELEKNLPKYTTSLDTSHSARNLGFIFDKHFCFLWPNYISLQRLLLSRSLTSLYPALLRFVNCLY